MTAPIVQDYAQQASALCKSCHMCCDGTLHASVILHPGEEARLKALRRDLVFEDDGQVRSLRQPCAADGAAGCAIYDARPHECRTFSCKTLQALAAGAIDAGEAHRRIGEVLGQRAQFVAASGATSLSEAARKARQDEARSRSDGQPLPKSAFEMLVLLRLIDLYLRPAEEALTMGGTDGKTADG